MPFYLGERQIAGLSINQNNYNVMETTFSDPMYLNQAYPNGNENAYMIGVNGAYSIFIWNESAHSWQDVANFGPYGDAMTGPRGFRGYAANFRYVNQEDVDGNEEIVLEMMQEPDLNWYPVITFKEAARENAESSRAQAELSREFQETARQENESDRISQEDERILNEGDRQSNEAGRMNNEGARESAENLRFQVEQLRKSNEETRQNNEGIRQQNEEDRISANANFIQFLSNRLPIYEDSLITVNSYLKYNVIKDPDGNYYECKLNAPAGTLLTNSNHFTFLTQLSSSSEINIITDSNYNDMLTDGSLKGEIFFVLA